MTFPISEDHRGAGFGSLTERERSVATAICLGATRETVADLHKISVKTVDTYRKRIIQKVGARNSVELARFAIREGFVSMHDEAP
jgi:DNA-binding NarL/FixJ family response regulator